MNGWDALQKNFILPILASGSNLIHNFPFSYALGSLHDIFRTIQPIYVTNSSLNIFYANQTIVYAKLLAKQEVLKTLSRLLVVFVAWILGFVLLSATEATNFCHPFQ